MERMEVFSPYKNTSAANSGVLGIPSESLLSSEDLGDVADPSATLKTLLDEVFSEELPDFEALFNPQGFSPSAAEPLAPPASSLAEKAALPQAPPWDLIATQAARQTQAQFPPVSPMEEPLAPLPFSDFVISDTHTPVLEPSVSLFEGRSETHMKTHLATTQEVATEGSFFVAASAKPLEAQANISPKAQTLSDVPAPVTPPRLPLADAPTAATEPFTIEPFIAEPPTEPFTAEPPKTEPFTLQAEEARELLGMLAPAEQAPLPSRVEKEVEKETATSAAPAFAAPVSAAPMGPIFHLSARPTFREPESQPVAATAPVFHPLEKTHEAVPAPLPALLGAFLLDAVLLCLASFGMLWAAKAFAEPGPASATSSWLGNMVAWQVLGPAGIALLALLATAYATFFAVLWNGATPGRKLLGLKLVNKEGHSIGFLQASLRSLFSLLSFGLALSGFWWALFDKRRQTFHDKCAGTFVVRVQPKP